MNDKQLDLVLEYLNNENDKEIFYNLNIDAADIAFINNKNVPGFTIILPGPLYKLYRLYKSLTRPDYSEIEKELGLEKIENHDDLYTTSKFTIQGIAPYIHLPMSVIGKYADNLKIFLKMANETKWDTIFDLTYAARTKINKDKIKSDIKNKKLLAAYITLGKMYANDKYYSFFCLCCYSVKSKSNKDIKYHTIAYTYDGKREIGFWVKDTVEDWGIGDLVK